MQKNEKRAFVTELSAALSGMGCVVVAHYAGLTVANMQTLRKDMRKEGAFVKVSKNRLTKLALQKTGFANFSSLLKGPTLIAYSQNPVSAPKVASAFAKSNDNFVLLGGAMGETMLTADGIKALASLPSLDELRGKLAGLLKAPATKVASVLQAPAGQLARVVGAYGAKT